MNFKDHEIIFNFQNDINENFVKSMKTLMDINNLIISKDFEIWIAKQPKISKLY